MNKMFLSAEHTNNYAGRPSWHVGKSFFYFYKKKSHVNFYHIWNKFHVNYMWELFYMLDVNTSHVKASISYVMIFKFF